VFHSPTSHHLDRHADRVSAHGDYRQPDDLISGPDLAAWLGVSLSWVEQARYGGHGPKFLKLGHRILYRVQNVRDWLSGRLHQSTAEYTSGAKARRGRPRKVVEVEAEPVPAPRFKRTR
jgi:hypothetical protein